MHHSKLDTRISKPNNPISFFSKQTSSYVTLSNGLISPHASNLRVITNYHDLSQQFQYDQHESHFHD